MPDPVPVAVPVEGFAGWLRAFAALVAEHREELTALDSAIGDADHGTNLDRGMSAVVAALDGAPPAGAGALFKQAGMTLVRTVGGASGPLYRHVLPAPEHASRRHRPQHEVPVTAAAFVRAARAGLDGLVARGKAEPGDKTMIDALAPAVDALEGELARGTGLTAALAAASAAADAGRGRDRPAAGAQGPRELPRRAQHRASGPRGDLGGAARGRGGADPGDPVTVGLVVVSHSRALARAAIELAAQMLPGGPVGIEEAAGLEDGSFGTDAVRVAEAVTRADDGRGVVVLADLGSAVLSAELALDLLDPALRERVTLSPGPLVEGLCVAAVAAAGGAERDEVAREATTALAAKQGHLGTGRSRGVAGAGTDLPAATGRIRGDLAAGAACPAGGGAGPRRPGVRGRRPPPQPHPGRTTAGSLAQVAALGAAQGHVLEVTASGRQAGAAVGRLLDLALTGFGDLDEPGERPER